ncbi:hypothetical protein [Microcoleus sp. D3_18_C2]
MLESPSPPTHSVYSSREETAGLVYNSREETTGLVYNSREGTEA